MLLQCIDADSSDGDVSFMDTSTDDITIEGKSI